VQGKYHLPLSQGIANKPHIEIGVQSYPITIAQGNLAAPNYNLTFINGTLTVTGESQTLTFPAIANTIYGPTPIT
jgi:hypothetical protein